ncbi:MAG TPA: site-specific integrase [Methylocystis sp.]
MAGKVKTVKLDTIADRAKLPARGTPFYFEIFDNAHLGYRKGSTRAVWVLRRWLGDRYEAETIGRADDHEQADDDKVLSFKQARAKAIKMAQEASEAAKGQPQQRKAKGAWTVTDAAAAYLEYARRETKGASITTNYLDTAILPKLGHIRLRDLTENIVKNWLFDLADSPRKTHGRAKLLAPPTTDEAKRKRRASANRTFNALRALLNRARKDGHVASDKAWKDVEPLAEADAARLRWLSSDEMRRLVAAADEPFKSLVVAALHSGCRYGELCRLAVEDFNAGSDSLLVRVSKSGKSRQIVLTKDACAFFKGLCAARAPHEVMLRRADGSAWTTGQQDRPMRAACAKAGIARANFHALRHTFASHAVMDSVSLMIVARLLGHADTKMVEKHYAHLSPDHIKETIQTRRKPLGLIDADDGNVVTLARR